MLIGELAKRTGTTTRALRFYEQEGLLTAERTASGYRDYPDHAVARVRSILELLRAGFTVADVRAFAPWLDDCVGRGDPHSLGCVVSYDLVGTRRIAAVEEQIAELTRQRDRLVRHLERGLTREPSTA